MKSEFVKIYCIMEPETRLVRYVGWTAKNLEDRLVGHLRDPRSMIMSKWLQSLKEKKLAPKIEFLEQVEWNARHKKEREWIIKFSSQGAPLLNRIHNPKHAERSFVC